MAANIPNLTPKLAARNLKDISLEEADYKADFEMTDKYEAFSSEILRLSLLSIAGYGYLISNVLSKAISDHKDPLYIKMLDNRVFFSVSVIALGLASGMALVHRFFSTSCLNYQVQILRHLKRDQNDNWTKDERSFNNRELENIRSLQRKAINKSALCITLSALLLLIGAVLTAVSFASTLF